MLTWRLQPGMVLRHKIWEVNFVFIFFSNCVNPLTRVVTLCVFFNVEGWNKGLSYKGKEANDQGNNYFWC
jgi:hypothetical protein